MDNVASLPQLSIPEIPDDFNGGVGVEYARAFRLLLQGAQVLGGKFELAEPFDAAALQQAVEDLQEQVKDNRRGQRTVVMDGVANGEVIVPFQGIGTTNYSVHAITQIAEGANPPTITYSLVENSRTETQCKVRIDGDGSTSKVMFVITEIREGESTGTGITT